MAVIVVAVAVATVPFNVVKHIKHTPCVVHK